VALKIVHDNPLMATAQCADGVVVPDIERRTASARSSNAMARSVLMPRHCTLMVRNARVLLAADQDRPTHDWTVIEPAHHDMCPCSLTRVNGN
jgi:hypothetical protein